MASKKELRTVLTLGGEREYSAGMQRIQRELGGVATQQSLLNSQYDKGDKSLAKLSQQQDILRKKLELQRQKVAQINKAYQESAKHGDETAEATAALAADLNMAQAAVNRTQRELNDLSEELSAANSRTAQFAAQMKSMGVTAQSVGSAMQTVGDRVSKVSLGIAAGVTGAAVKGWMTLEDEMANVATIADTSEKSVDELTDEILAVSDATGVAAKDLAAAQYQAISANVATADSAELVGKAAMAAKAGVADVTTVIDGATSILNAWGIAASDSEQVFDKLLKTQQRGKTTIGELASGIGQVTGLAPQLNMSLDETLAAVAALTQSGVGTSEAFNGLKAVMSGILKPTAEAREEAERLGLEFDAAALKSKGFTGFLADVVEKTGGSEESLAKLFGSVEGLSQVMLLGGNAAGMYADILGDLGSSAGTLETMFGARTSSAAQRFSAALNRISNAAINLGQSLAPMIDLAADKIEEFAQAISGMSAEEGMSLIKTALWIAGISKGVSVLGGLIKTASTAAKAIKAIGTLLTPGGAVIGGIALAGAAVAGLSGLMSRLNAKATLDLTVDKEQLENYRIDPTELKDPIEITAQAKLQIKRDLKGFGAGITDWLTDGKKETQDELDQYVSDLNGYIGTAFTSIDSYIEQKRGELDAQLAAGLITPEEYEASITALEGQATAMETELTTAANAVTSYISTLVSQNRAATDEEIAQLELLLTTLYNTSAAVLDATNAQKAAYEWSYQKVAAGQGDATDRKKAVEYIEIQYSTNEQTLKAAEDATRAKYASLAVGASDAEIAALAAQEEAELAEIQAQLDQLQAEREEMYGNLLAAELEKQGISLEEFETYQKWKGQTDDLASLTQNYLMAGDMEAAGEMTAIAAAVKKVSEADLTGIKEIGAFLATNTGLDASKVEDVDKAYQTLIDTLHKTEEFGDLPNEFIKIGDAVIDGLNGSLKAGYGPLRSTMQNLAYMIAEETRNVLKIHSPSRVFDQIGKFTMEGLIGGVNSQVERVQRAYKAAVTPKDVTSAANNGAGRAAAPAPVINNYVNYTAGAGTRREARMLNQRLAQEQQAALIAEGL